MAFCIRVIPLPSEDRNPKNDLQLINVSLHLSTPITELNIHYIIHVAQLTCTADGKFYVLASHQLLSIAHLMEIQWSEDPPTQYLSNDLSYKS